MRCAELLGAIAVACEAHGGLHGVVLSFGLEKLVPEVLDGPDEAHLEPIRDGQEQRRPEREHDHRDRRVDVEKVEGTLEVHSLAVDVPVHGGEHQDAGRAGRGREGVEPSFGLPGVRVCPTGGPTRPSPLSARARPRP